MNMNGGDWTESGMVVKDECGLWMNVVLLLYLRLATGYYTSPILIRSPIFLLLLTVCSRVIHAKNCLSRTLCLKM